MEDKSLSEQESLQLITKMINQAKIIIMKVVWVHYCGGLPT